MRSRKATRSLTRVDACNPLLQAHPTWARDEHEGREISTSLTPVSGHLALPPSRSPTRSTHLGWGTWHTHSSAQGPPGLETPTIGDVCPKESEEPPHAQDQPSSSMQASPPTQNEDEAQNDGVSRSSHR